MKQFVQKKNPSVLSSAIHVLLCHKADYNKLYQVNLNKSSKYLENNCLVSYASFHNIFIWRVLIMSEMMLTAKHNVTIQHTHWIKGMCNPESKEHFSNL